jgi:EAL domain-containing protein (putative c-di-GMP-specific phosphodiesterase class I)
LILAISSWVADSVFAQCRAWREAGLPLERVAINLPARQLDLPDLPEVFSQLLDKHGLRDMAPIIELEITEGMMMHRPEQAIRTLDELKAMNFSVSVDDFGTGYSSLAYLKRLPIDKLKIDRLFIKDVPRNAEDVAIVRGVIAMAHELGLVVVAEGVEEDAQRDFLHAHGCDAIQGYLLGKPMPAEQFTGLFENMILH